MPSIAAPADVQTHGLGRDAACQSSSPRETLEFEAPAWSFDQVLLLRSYEFRSVRFVICVQFGSVPAEFRAYKN